MKTSLVGVLFFIFSLMTEFEPTSPESADMGPTLGSPGLDERKVRDMVAQHIADIFKD